MTKITSYIMRRFLVYFFYTFLLLTAILLVTYVFENLDWLSKGEASLPAFFLLFFFRYITFARELVPVSLLMSTLFLFTSLKNTRELLAVQVGGIPLRVVIIPFCVTGLFFSFFSFFLGSNVIPWAVGREKAVYQEKIKHRPLTRQTRVFDLVLSDGENAKYTFSFFDTEKGYGEDFTYDLIRESRPERQIVAGRIYYRDGEWILEDGVEREFAGFGIQREERFSTKIIPFPLAREDFHLKGKDFEELTTAELKRTVFFLKKQGLDNKRETVGYYFRYSFPLSSFIVILWAIIFSLRTPDLSRLKAFFLSLLVTCAYWGIVALFRSQGETGTIPPFLSAWLPNLIFLGTGAVLIFK